MGSVCSGRPITSIRPHRPERASSGASPGWLDELEERKQQVPTHRPRSAACGAINSWDSGGTGERESNSNGWPVPFLLRRLLFARISSMSSGCFQIKRKSVQANKNDDNLPLFGSVMLQEQPALPHIHTHTHTHRLRGCTRKPAGSGGTSCQRITYSPLPAQPQVKPAGRFVTLPLLWRLQLDQQQFCLPGVRKFAFAGRQQVARSTKKL